MFELRRSTMNASYSIPETAKLTGIPEHAIREYAKQFADVLPEPETSESGRATVRRYPDAALAIFRSIRKLKDEGLDTVQIRSALQGPGGTDGYSHWDNVALQTSAESALDGEAGCEMEWTEEGPEAEIGTAPVETADAAYHETTGSEWTASEAEGAIEVQVTAEAEEHWSEESVHAEVSGESAPEEAMTAPETTVEETVYEAWADAPEALAVTAEETTEAASEAAATVEETGLATETFHPLFNNLSDGLLQLRKIMDENTLERGSLRTEREMLLAETAAQSGEIDQLKSTVATQEEKISGLQGALSVLMGQCDQQLQAIRNALGQP
jgi:DNA-binding transcriptional MerR regulator